MTDAAFLLAGLREALGTDPDAVLSIASGARVLQPGFHVTQVRLAEIRALDCGWRVERWQEVVIEMTDDALPPGRALTAGALDRILSEATAGADPAALPVAEIGGAVLGRYDLVAAAASEGALRLELAPRGARCPAAARSCGGCCA